VVKDDWHKQQKDTSTRGEKQKGKEKCMRKIGKRVCWIVGGETGGVKGCTIGEGH